MQNGKYTKVKKATKTDEKINPNEIRITSTGKTRSYISYATNLLQENKEDKVVIKAMGKAINKGITIAEIVKHRVEGLHQITELDSNEITEEFETTEEGLPNIEKKRTVSSISITLSLKTLDTKHIGYQKPIPVDQVKDLSQMEIEDESEEEVEKSEEKKETKKPKKKPKKKPTPKKTEEKTEEKKTEAKKETSTKGGEEGEKKKTSSKGRGGSRGGRGRGRGRGRGKSDEATTSTTTTTKTE